MKRLLLWFLPGLVILAGDRIVKIVTDGMETVLLDGVIAIHSTRNTGAAMGLLTGKTLLIILLSLLLIGAAIWLMRGMRLSGMAPLSLSLIAGGAIGNLIDRAFLGYVVDMIEIEFMRFAVFNVADCFVVCGAILLVIYAFFFDQPAKKEEHAHDSDC